jgi:hypothetical protein
MNKKPRPPSSSRLIDLCQTVFVVAHKENTARLESTLRAQGFEVTVQRGPYTKEQEQFAAATRCLINHAHVWAAVAQSGRPAIVVEADFVPVTHFADRPPPLPDLDQPASGFAWLYSAGSTLYGFDPQGFPHGHGNTTVAYMINPRVAAVLMEFYEREMARNPTGRYVQWETYLGIFLRKERGVLNYIPTYQYGEHGGVGSKEHSRAGIRGWHQADVLMGPLSFTPDYAIGSRMRYAAIRARAVVRAWARLVLLRFFDPRYVNSDSSRGRVAMASFSILRLLRCARG